MYLLAINQALPYGCSFVTYGHPEGSAAGEITIIWNVFKDVRGWQFLTMKASETLYIVCLPSEKHIS